MAALYVNGASENVNKRSDAGYYVDFPVWFRTSSSVSEVTGLTKTGGTPAANTHLQLGVKATITQNTGTESVEDLYHAVRIAVIPTTGDWDATTSVADTTAANITGVIHDGVEKEEDKKYWDRYDATNSELTGAGIFARQAVKHAGTLGFDPSTNKQTNVGDLYGTADIVKQATTKDATTGFYSDGEAVVSVPLAATANEYGNPVKYIIRVWLEGEDQYCWNPNAGQDWNVALQFVKLTDADADTNAHAAPTAASATLATYAGTSSSGDAATAGSTSAEATTIKIKIDGTEKGAYNVTTGEFDVAVVAILDSTVTVAEGGTGDKTYQLDDGTRIGNTTDLKNYILAHKAEYDFSDGINLKQIIPASP